MNDIKEYIKELQQLKSLGLIEGAEAEELDKLIRTMEGLEKQGETMNEENDWGLNINFVNNSDNPDPNWTKEGDSGLDLRANLTEPITLKPLKRVLVPTGLHFQLPIGYDMDIKSRSGLAFKNGIMILTGTIDNNYRGEIKVLLFNTGEEDFVINHGDRIAQAVIRPVVTNIFGKLIKTETLEVSNRNADGFGSTGKN